MLYICNRIWTTLLVGGDMTQNATLHIKLDRGTDNRLKKLAYDRHTSKGQLVREALATCYQTSLTEMPFNQRSLLPLVSTSLEMV